MNDRGIIQSALLHVNNIETTKKENILKIQEIEKQVERELREFPTLADVDLIRIYERIVFLSQVNLSLAQQQLSFLIQALDQNGINMERQSKTRSKPREEDTDTDFGEPEERQESSYRGSGL